MTEFRDLSSNYVGANIDNEGFKMHITELSEYLQAIARIQYIKSNQKTTTKQIYKPNANNQIQGLQLFFHITILSNTISSIRNQWQKS